MKTVEEMRKAVLAYCETFCPDTFRPRVLHSRFVAIWRKLKWNLEPYFEVIIGCNTLVVDETFEHWDFLYHALGLSERDAVAELREESDKYFTELKAERARNAALVAALGKIRNACRIAVTTRDFQEKGTMYKIETCIDSALAANEKGGINA